MPISENEIIVPALLAMYNSPNNEIQTSKLIIAIANNFNLDSQDLSPLLNRQDEKFTQIVRNLKSHKTLKDLGYAEEIDGGFRILQKGIDWLILNGFVI